MTTSDVGSFSEASHLMDNGYRDVAVSANSGDGIHPCSQVSRRKAVILVQVKAEFSCRVHDVGSSPAEFAGTERDADAAEGGFERGHVSLCPGYRR